MLCSLFVAVFVASLAVLSQGEFTLFDKAEFERRPRVKYHLYDPQLFDMYSKCLPMLRRPCYGTNDHKHSVDVLFLESIIALNESVDPWDATLFVVPVLYSQLDGGANAICRTLNAQEGIAQMYEVLHSLGHYKPGARNHFLVADHPDSGFFQQNWVKFSFEPQLIVGRFENPAYSDLYSRIVKEIDPFQFINVGYASHLSLIRNCPERVSKDEPPPLTYRSRRFLLSFTGGCQPVYWQNNFFYRNVLQNYTVQHTLPHDTFVHIYQKHQPMTEKNRRINGAEVLRNSDFVLNLSGDTPTTERIWDAFEHHTMLCALSKEKEALLRLMPFPNRVPWEELFLWIDSDEFVKDPVKAARDTILGLSSSEKERRYNLMLKHKRDVLWGYKDSVTVFNVLEEATLNVRSLHAV